MNDKMAKIIRYLIFGVLTTAVNFIVYFFLSRSLHAHYLGANVGAWLVSVIFAFLTNKKYVFCSKDYSGKALIRESSLFVLARAFSGFLDTAVLAAGVDLLHFSDVPVKVAAAILVVILNYVFSQWIIFRKQDREAEA